MAKVYVSTAANIENKQKAPFGFSKGVFYAKTEMFKALSLIIL